MATNAKYGHVTIEHGNIPDDEPVFIFRYKDKTLPVLVSFYAMLSGVAGSPDEFVADLLARVMEITVWQAENGSKTPGVPAK